MPVRQRRWKKTIRTKEFYIRAEESGGRLVVTAKVYANGKEIVVCRGEPIGIALQTVRAALRSMDALMSTLFELALKRVHRKAVEELHGILYKCKEEWWPPPFVIRDIVADEEWIEASKD